MLFVVAILLFFGAVVRHKWRNAAAKKEEILRIIAETSHEEDEIARLQGVDVYESPPPPPPPSMQIQKRYYCAVCYSSTTTRCSQCKAIRYCSGKCQIIHWRQGHKDECRPASSLHESKESASSVVTASVDQNEIISNNDSEVRSGPAEQLDNNGSSCSSLHCLSSSSSEHSLASFDVSSSGTFEPGTSIGTDKVSSGGIDNHTSQSASDSDEADVPSVCVSPLNSTVQAINSKISSSSKHSVTSLDASSSGIFESGTSIGTDKVSSGGLDYHKLQSTSDSDEANVPSVCVSPLKSTVQAVDNKTSAKKKENSQDTDPDDGFRATNTEDNRIGSVATVSEDCMGATEFRSLQSLDSSKISLSVGNHANPAHLSCNKVTKSLNSRKSVNHQQVSIVDIRNSPCSKSLSTTSLEDFWGDEAQLPKSTETRPSSFGLSENDEMISKIGRAHILLSELEGAQTSSPPTSKALKTSKTKFVDHFRIPKLSKSSTFAIGKGSTGKYSHKIIFHPELFMQLYSCDGVELHPVGLINCGNSCYANAVLQCLTFTRPISAYLLQGLHSKTCHKRDWCLICEFEHLIQKGQEKKSPLSPVGILSQIQKIGNHLSHGREEDAHDFLRNVIDTMQSIWLDEAHVSGSLAEDSTLLGLTFGGYLRSKIKCMKCLGRSEQYDRMMDLTVEIDGDINTLEQALAQFTICEILAGDDKYKCSRCMSYEKAEKQLTIIEAPNILTIVLKRFRSGNLEKLNKLVRYPEKLNLAPYMSGMSDKYPMYHLYGVVVHLNMANTAYSGHYISYVKDFRGEWFKIDDSRVSHVQLDTVLSAEAYMLFYARRTPQGPLSLTNNVMHSDGKPRRSVESIPSSKKKNSKPKLKHPREISGIHAANYDDWGPVCQNPILESSSGSSSIFSVSDTGSCSTDSTKDSNVEDIFGSNLHHP